MGNKAAGMVFAQQTMPLTKTLVRPIPMRIPTPMNPFSHQSALQSVLQVQNLNNYHNLLINTWTKSYMASLQQPQGAIQMQLQHTLL